MSLQTLSVEVQRAILLSLDYASLCQIRSTGRYWYNLLTEQDVHGVFLNIELAHTKKQSGGMDDHLGCRYCAQYCEATVAQVEDEESRKKAIKQEIHDIGEKFYGAIREVRKAQKALKATRAGRPTTAAKRKEKSTHVAAAKTRHDLAHEALKAAKLDLRNAPRLERGYSNSPPDTARKCCSCRRVHNGYLAPGVFIPITPDVTGWSLLAEVGKGCARCDNRIFQKYQRGGSVDGVQRDGKICKVCWEGTGRGASGIQRRRAFIEDHGYWLWDTWMRLGQKIDEKQKLIASKSFEDIEKEKDTAAGKEAEKALPEAEKKN